MTIRRIAVTGALLALVCVAAVHAADVTGKWTSTFNTDAGEQSYTWELVVKGSTITGTSKSNLVGDAKIEEGKVDGDKITFVEIASFMDMPLRIEYTGAMTSADEIKFSRKVGDFATEQFVARRAK